MRDYKRFWGDSHTNIHHKHMGNLARCLTWAREMLDFWPIAYYPFHMGPVKGFDVEDWWPREIIDDDWKRICDLAAANNHRGRFVSFPGYEWHGTGDDGDHNVFYIQDHPPLVRCDTLKELYESIRRNGAPAFAIPHHTGYITGIRGKNWDIHDQEISPFAEIFSNHGSSEDDSEWIGLRQNRNMGPGCSGGTIEDGLNRGLRVGIIASNDSHGGLGGVYGSGIMGCYARELTRASVWEAFAERRVYGVTGDRIELDFAVEDAPMGAVIRRQGPVRSLVQVRCTDALDRIELLRNNRPIANHCHLGTCQPPSGSRSIRCKLRVEAGWNTTPKAIQDQPPRDWTCRIEVDGGTIVGAERCWKAEGQRLGALGDSRCDFGFLTRQTLSEGSSTVDTEATVFEIEAAPTAEIKLDIDGKKVRMTIAEAMAGSRIVHWTPENTEDICRRFGLKPSDLPRKDRMYYWGPKAKVHRAIPEAGLTGILDFTDAAPPPGRNHYRVRVTQRNGQVAWSSPVWVDNE